MLLMLKFKGQKQEVPEFKFNLGHLETGRQKRQRDRDREKRQGQTWLSMYTDKYTKHLPYAYSLYSLLYPK